MKESMIETIAPAPVGTSYREVLKRQLHASPTNPRTEFQEESIEEMAESVRKHGIIQPLIARRWPEKDRAGEEAFEIVCGERRFRGASRVAELEWIPVIVRVMSDMEVREIQIIENLQREDVSPYDEAVGYAALLELQDADGGALYSVERIAEKIGKAVTYVRNRLKMQRTPKALLEALRKGLVGTRICEMVGRIPHAEDRERCAAEILENQYYDRPMTIEEAQEHIHEEYMVSLGAAPFDRKAEDLLPKAGSCEGCRFRTGNDPDLAEDLASGLVDLGGGRKAGVDPQICQNPKCYRDKCEAFLLKVKSEDPERVLSDEEAKSAFDDWGNVRHSGKLKRADKKPEYADVGHYNTGKLKSWGDYARKLGVPVKLAKNPKSGEIVQLVEASAVKAAERSAAPEKPVFVQKGGGSGEGAEKSYQEQEKRRREEQAEEVRIAFDRLSGNLVGQLGRSELLVILGQAVDHQGIDVMLRWMGIAAGPQPKGREFVSARAHKIEAIIAAVRDDAEKFDREAILILTLMAQFSEAVSYSGIETTRFKEFAKARGVDLKEVKKAAKEVVKERRQSKKAAKAKKDGKGEKAPSLKGDVAAVRKCFPEGLPASRVELQEAMEWSQERTLAAWDEIRKQEGENSPPAGGSLEADLVRVLESASRRSGTVKLGWQEIAGFLGLAQDADGQMRALEVFDALIDRDVIVKGVYVPEVGAAALASMGSMVSAAVPGSGKSKLAAAAEKKGVKGGEG